VGVKKLRSLSNNLIEFGNFIGQGFFFALLTFFAHLGEVRSVALRSSLIKPVTEDHQETVR
jgi:hypothetical protein